MSEEHPSPSDAPWHPPDFQVVDQVFARYGRVLVGLSLIALGMALFLAQFFQIALLRYLWPLFILVPGLALFFAAMRAPHEVAQGLIVPGSIITMLGLLLLYQLWFNHWESWAYAWSLLPLSIGLGQMIYGYLRGYPNLLNTGRGLVQVFGIIFAAGFFFFEMILNISDMGIWAWIALFIGGGVYLIWRSLRAGSQSA